MASFAVVCLQNYKNPPSLATDIYPKNRFESFFLLVFISDFCGCLYSEQVAHYGVGFEPVAFGYCETVTHDKFPSVNEWGCVGKQV